MLWVNFIHLYQPANSDNFIVEEATKYCYEQVVKMMENNPRVKFTVNITGCLVELWNNLGYSELIERIKNLVAKGQIELVGSVSYHCLVPLVPKKEVARQIKENTRILKAAFGEDIKLRGFFFPEMAFSPEAGKIVKNSGFEWAILDEITHNGKLGEIDFNKVYRGKQSGLKAVFRSRDFSSCYVPQALNQKFMYKDLVITATDGELYGLRHKDQGNDMEKLLKNEKITFATISEFIDSHKTVEEADLVSSNWESTEKDLSRGEPYALWCSQSNPIHRECWELANLAVAAVEKYRRDPNHKWARFHLCRGLASCTFWWASAKDFSYIFGPKAWNPDAIERGVNEFLRAVRSIEDVDSREAKMEAEKLGVSIKRLIWKKHWASHWKLKPEEGA